MKKTIYILGNPLLVNDNLPIRLMPKLQKLCPMFFFQQFDPTEELPVGIDKELILIDTVIGIDKVEIFHNLSHFNISPRVSVHDYDLPINLGLMEKLGKIKKITIFGVPSKGNEEKIIKELINLLYLHLTFRK